MLSWTATVAAVGFGRSRSAGSSAPPGAIATARRLRPRPRRPRDAPAGLAAFEDAPCFLEVVEREAQRYREAAARSTTGRSNAE